MKKIVLFLISAAVITASAAPPAAAEERSLGLSIGPVIWYAWWSPFIENLLRGDSVDSLRSSFKMKDSTFMYGPALSYQFNGRWNISGVFVFSVHRGYRAKSQYLFIPSPSTITWTRQNLDNIYKYDLDVTVNYALNKYMKFFFGLKSQLYNYDGGFYTIISQPVKFSLTSLYYSIGPGSGFGLTVNLVDNLYLLANISAIALYGSFQVEYFKVKKINNFLTYGGNTNMSLAYYIEKIKTTISLGGRYQLLRSYMFSGADDKLDNSKFNADQFYGITLSIIYSL